MTSSRRDFLRRTTCAALSAAAAQAGLRKLGLMNLLARPLAPSDYRALVCVFLDGGNDSNNMVVPTDSTHYNQYLAARPLASGLGLDAAALAPINVPPVFSGSGRTFGFHPSLSQMASLFNQNRLALVSNVGPLVVPVTQSDVVNDTKPLPYSLFSHSDQIQCWSTGRADQRIATGWGGRVADATLACNADSGFPTVTSIDGAATFCVGIAQNPLAIDTGALDQILVLNGYYGSPDDVARKNSMDFARTIDRTALLVAAASDVTQQAVDIGAALSVDPTLDDRLPGHGPRRPAPAGRQGDQAEPDLAAAVAEPPDLLRDAGRIRHAPGPGVGPGRSLRRALRRAERLLRGDRRARAAEPRRRPSPCRTSAARSSRPATPAPSERTTAGAATSS